MGGWLIDLLRVTRPKGLFAFGLLAFAVLAILGWLKLPYGVSLADEGMYVADAWRLTAGDRLFPDASTGVLRLYALLNGAVFQLNPDVTLLGFRQLQFFLTLTACGLLGFAVWRFSGLYWPLPWLFSLFAFTGMDPVGKVSSLSYYHYPHLFLVGHVALLLLALCEPDGGFRRRALLVASGVCLFAIGFALLPLSVSAVGPLLLWLVARRMGGRARFGFADMLWLLAPVAVLWFGVLAWFGAPFFTALSDMLRYASQGGKIQAHLDEEGIKHALIMAVALCLAGTIRLLPKQLVVPGALALGGVVWWGVDSGFGGLIAPYWRGWFADPMWFCGLLMAGLLSYGCFLALRMVRPKALDRDGWLLLLLLLPSGVLAAVFAYFSEIGFLTTAYAAMPVWLGLGLMLVKGLSAKGVKPLAQGIALLALVVPFTWQIAWADWRFTLFDLSPKYLTRTIDDGFLKGINTNPAFYEMDRWLRDRADRTSGPDDLAIVLERVSMVHVQIKRRPALNHSWVGLMRSSLLRYEAMKQMREAGREPKIAFRFVQIPAFYPVSLDDELYTLAPPATYYPNHSISNHITGTMRLVDTFKVAGRPWIEFYIRD
jgi:hypothetical protein